jgi:hypothetical protein
VARSTIPSDGDVKDPLEGALIFNREALTEVVHETVTKSGVVIYD